MGVRTDNYSVFVEVKISENFDFDNITEIYDLKNDPYENNNLKDSKDIMNKICKEIDIIKTLFLDLKKEYGEN